MLRRAHRWVGRVGNGLGRLLDLLGSLLGDGLLGDGRLLGDCLRGGGHLGGGGLDGRLLGGGLLGDDGLLGGGLPGDGLLLHDDVVDAARLREGEKRKCKCLETGTPQGQCRSWRESAHLSSERRRQRQARAAALIPLLILRTRSEVATDLDGSRWPELGLNLGPLRETKADWHLCEAPMEHVGVVEPDALC